MKSKDLQQLVLSKYESGDTTAKIYRDLNGAISYDTVRRWCNMIEKTGAIQLSAPSGPPRIIRTKQMIQKAKNRLKRKKKVSSRILAHELSISRTSVRRILKDDLQYHAYKVRVVPLLKDEHNDKRKRFSNWMRTYFKKETTMKILFSDEKMFDIDGVYNLQNDRIWAVNRHKADKAGGRKQKRKFSEKVMVWLGVCSKGISPLVILSTESMNHERYIKDVLPVPLKYGNGTFGNDWIFQQDNATPHTHILTEQWCHDHFPMFIDKDHWPPNSPELNPLDYCIWDEFVGHINWNNVQSKVTLIVELKRAVKKIRLQIVFESCKKWTNRLYRLKENDFDYLD